MGGSNSIPSSLIHDNLNRYNSAPRLTPSHAIRKEEAATEDVILKTPEEIEKEKEEKEKKRQEYYKNNALAIHIHKEMCLQRTLNKNFKVKFPIESIQKFPVDVFFVFTWLAQSNVHFEDYHVEFHIYEKGNLQKLLYVEKLTFPLRHSSIPWDFREYDYFIMRNSSSNYIFEINYYFKMMNNTILNLKKDTFMECFTEDEIKINVSYEVFSLDQKVPNEYVEFSRMYTCEKCGGQTKNESSICYFCVAAEGGPSQKTADLSSP